MSSTGLTETPASPDGAAAAAPPSALDAMLAEAMTHHRDGRLAEAEALYRGIVGAPGVHAVAAHNLGLLWYAQGRLQEAGSAFQHAIAVRPDFADAYNALGATVLALGQPQEAIALYQRAIATQPNNAMAHSNLGKALQDIGRLDDAVAAYRTAIMHEPANAVAHANLGAALLAQEAWAESLGASERAAELRPDNAAAHVNRAAALLHLDRHTDALEACRLAETLGPREAITLSTLGGTLTELGAPEQAAVVCRQAVAADPRVASAHFNLSHAYKAMNRLEEAAAAARQAIALQPDNADYHHHLSHILLLAGDYGAGWAEYDWRWAKPDFAWLRGVHGDFSQPRWNGEDIGGRTILVYTEQGLGDIIQFARYLKLLTRRAGRVIVAAHPPVRRLLDSIDGIEVVGLHEPPLPAFDVHCPLMSLPRAFGTRLDNIPADIPYLRSEPAERARWRQRLAQAGLSGGLRVGIIWAGNPAVQRDRFRSPRLEAVMPLFAVPGVDFVSLQVGAGREDLAHHTLPGNVLDLGSEIGDLAETAAIIEELDLVITSCTAPLHLAGALGVACWGLIAFAPHFAWVLGRDDTDWYPSVRLYRQGRMGTDWSDVVGRMAGDLAGLAASGRRAA
jgi:tetratricopeptide (TPR) repeat protein